MPLHALLIADNPTTHTAVENSFPPDRARRPSVTVTIARTWQDARVRLVLEAFDVVLLADRVGDASALDVLNALAGLPHPPVIVLTPDADLDRAMRVLRAGASDCVMRHLANWTTEVRLAVERLTASARHRGALAEQRDGVNEYAAVLAALLLRRQTPLCAPARLGA